MAAKHRQELAVERESPAPEPADRAERELLGQWPEAGRLPEQQCLPGPAALVSQGLVWAAQRTTFPEPSFPASYRSLEPHSVPEPTVAE